MEGLRNQTDSNKNKQKLFVLPGDFLIARESLLALCEMREHSPPTHLCRFQKRRVRALLLPPSPALIVLSTDALSCGIKAQA